MIDLESILPYCETQGLRRGAFFVDVLGDLTVQKSQRQEANASNRFSVS
jgi:hypothetical protein